VPFVVDASVTMAWCFEDEATSETDAILDRLTSDEALVPQLWALEVTNVLLIAERRGRIDESKSARFVQLLAELPILLESRPPHMNAALAAGRRHGLSAYDAAYLLLAQREGLALATRDDGLTRAAREVGVPLLV
jgi:predicted nucleic acid-binding protein